MVRKQVCGEQVDVMMTFSDNMRLMEVTPIYCGLYWNHLEVCREVYREPEPRETGGEPSAA